MSFTYFPGGQALANPTWQHPFTSLISGPTNSGKSFFVRRLLESQRICPPVALTILCYGQYQPLFDEMKETGRPARITCLPCRPPRRRNVEPNGSAAKTDRNRRPHATEWIRSAHNQTVRARLSPLQLECDQYRPKPVLQRPRNANYQFELYLYSGV